MAYDVKESPTGGTRAVMSPPTPPKMSDFDLTSVRIERVNNGVVIECNHKMKPEVEQKMRGKSGKDYVEYDVRNPSEKHVFDDVSAASEFIEARLMGKDYEKKEKADAGPKVKVKVTK